jgi:hypothetical protein
MVLAHDAFEAARWFIGVEYGDMVVPWDGITIKLRRDADIVDEDYDRREADYRGTYRWAMIDIRRAELARGRAEFLRALRTRQLPGDVV